LTESKTLNKHIDSEASEKQTKTKELFQGIAFYLEDRIFCLDIMNIRDIITARRMYKVPNTNERLLGAINLRGEILPVYSLKLILEMQDDLKGLNMIEEQEDDFIITIKKDRDIFGVFVDAIYRNISVTDENFREGTYIKKWSKNYIFDGVILEEDKEILNINIENLLRYMISLK
jgi:purine-binding chemotaxis protein CheW